ncbi:MAG: hypothetical protein AB1486_07895 [Planctomycetota bacterium]
MEGESDDIVTRLSPRCLRDVRGIYDGSTHRAFEISRNLTHNTVADLPIEWRTATMARGETHRRTKVEALEGDTGCYVDV